MRPPTLLQLRPALAALLLAAPLAAPLWAQAGGHRVDLSRPIFIGDSLTAGYQNGSLHEDFQPRGYASWIAARADVADANLESRRLPFCCTDCLPP